MGTDPGDRENKTVRATEGDTERDGDVKKSGLIYSMRIRIRVFFSFSFLLNFASFWGGKNMPVKPGARAVLPQAPSR